MSIELRLIGVSGIEVEEFITEVLKCAIVEHRQEQINTFCKEEVDLLKLYQGISKIADYEEMSFYRACATEAFNKMRKDFPIEISLNEFGITFPIKDKIEYRYEMDIPFLFQSVREHVINTNKTFLRLFGERIEKLGKSKKIIGDIGKSINSGVSDIGRNHEKTSHNNPRGISCSDGFRKVVDSAPAYIQNIINDMGLNFSDENLDHQPNPMERQRYNNNNNNNNNIGVMEEIIDENSGFLEKPIELERMLKESGYRIVSTPVSEIKPSTYFRQGIEIKAYKSDKDYVILTCMPDGSIVFHSEHEISDDKNCEEYGRIIRRKIIETVNRVSLFSGQLDLVTASKKKPGTGSGASILERTTSCGLSGNSTFSKDACIAQGELERIKQNL